MRAVATRLSLARPAPVVVTVGGTNGKGSTVAFLEAMLRAGGYRVGAYTSPHLIRYNERVRIDGADADDDALVASFERIEAARGDTPLTYFEYGTLAALELFARARVDVALLEVGLGGRLDAVNIVDADVSIVTTVDLDHQDWLGDDREAIAREKAGIFRAARPAVVGELEPPATLLAEIARIGALPQRAGVEYAVEALDAGCWRWTHEDGTTLDLPQPLLEVRAQRTNAAAAIAALHALRDRLAISADAIAAGVRGASAPGRLQRSGGAIETIVDVAHNPQAARELAAWLGQHPAEGRTHAVFGALADKDVAGIVSALRDAVDAWHLAGLDRDSPRGLAAGALRGRAGAIEATVSDDVASALRAARAAARPGDRIVAFGSFFVASAALA